MSEWISVEDRLPAGTFDVLATDGYDCTVAFLSAGGSWFAMYDGSIAHENGLRVEPKVKFWMPLPEPPR